MFVPSGSASQEKLGIAVEYTTFNKPPADFPSSLDTWETFTHTFDGDINNRLYIHISSTDGAGSNKAIFNGVTGDHVYIRNLKVTQVLNGATVVTWYDQSGNSNDATQPTTGSQPLIAENGSLLNDIDFDGVDDFLEVDNSTATSTPNLSLIHISEPTRPY